MQNKTQRMPPMLHQRSKECSNSYRVLPVMTKHEAFAERFFVTVAECAFTLMLMLTHQLPGAWVRGLAKRLCA